MNDFLVNFQLKWDGNWFSSLLNWKSMLDKLLKSFFFYELYRCFIIVRSNYIFLLN